MNVPLVSVVLPVFNGARFVPGAVACIRRQAGPHPDAATGFALEITAVDDASDDGGRTADALATARENGGIDRVLRLEANLGPAAARNAGVRVANGEFLAFLDVDDRWPAGHLARMWRTLSAAPEGGFVLCAVQGQRRVGPTGTADDGGDDAEGGFEDFGAPGPLPVFSAGLFRREAFSRVGPLDENLRFGEDVDWFLRAREAGVDHVTTGETVLRYRLHEGNVTRDREAARRGLARALHQSLRRRADAAKGCGPAR